MEILLIAPILIFLFTLLVPALASANGETPKDPRAIRRAKEAATAAERSVDYLKAEHEHLKQTNAALHEQKAIKDELARADLEHRIAKQKLIIEENGLTTESAKKIAELSSALKNLTETQGKSQTVADELVNTMAGMLGVSDDLSGSFLGLAGDSKGLQDVLDRVVVGLSKTFTTAKLLDAASRKLSESTMIVALAQDMAYASFVRTTGAMAGRYGDAITSTFHNTRILGVTMGEAGEATSALYTEMVRFTKVDRATQVQLVDTVATMAEFGIATSSTSRLLNTLTTVMHMSASGAIAQTEALVQISEQIGLPVQRMVDDLVANAPALAAWGDQMVEVFIDLQKAARATGTTVGQLVGITDQFTTFYGAAEAVGRLHSLLGGPYLNAMELVNMTQDEQILKILEYTEAMGASWQTLDQHTRRAIASILTSGDMELAAKLLSQTTAEYTANLALNSAELRTNEERAQAAQSVADIFQATLQSLAIEMRPVVEIFRDVALGLARVLNAITNNPVGEFLLTFLLIVTSLTPFVLTLTAALWALGASLTGAFFPISMAASALGLLATIFTVSHSPTFSEYIGHAAENLDALTNSARRAKSVIRDLNPHLGAMKSSVVGVVTAKVTNADEKMMFNKMMKSNEEYIKRLEAVANRDIVLKMKGREFGRATKDFINRDMRLT